MKVGYSSQVSPQSCFRGGYYRIAWSSKGGLQCLFSGLQFKHAGERSDVSRVLEIRLEIFGTDLCRTCSTLFFSYF